ncbi:MAG: hypothetical protein ABS82_00970 [Rhodanobacter sp. SCN 67-45]|jgi:hypothetical protein|nr:MAG: hypothetical protein ABS82_00970 [Rhodanobacter sp. SCN 67-45]
MIVTTRHMLTIPGFTARGGFCRTGSQAWARSHGLDWHAFVLHGIEEEKLLATDAFGVALVEWAHQCAAAEQADKEQAHG